MSAKACLLCGKPLGRLRVGGDGEFCSREHRNQHRLRRGMDRLEEANKVTSLIRRRENPRHILAARLMCNSACWVTTAKVPVSSIAWAASYSRAEGTAVRRRH